jgi:predicted transcriptional regulator
MLTARQIRGARAMLGIDQPGLAQMAGLSRPTIQRLEHPDYGPDHSALRVVRAVMRALEEAGVEFIPAGDGKGEGVRLRAPTA